MNGNACRGRVASAEILGSEGCLLRASKEERGSRPIFLSCFVVPCDAVN